MGKKNRGKSGTVTFQESTDGARPVFTDNKAGNVEFTGYVISREIKPKYLFSLSKGWVWYHYGVRWSWAQYFKFQLRKVLRLPIEADDPRDLVTWQRKKLSSIMDIPTE